MVQGPTIRQSQFILTYGVGSLVQVPRGRSRVIPEISEWSKELASDPESYIADHELEIGADKATQTLVEDARVFTIPTNADLGLPDEVPIFRTRPFPTWGLCENHDPKILGPISTSANMTCPKCHQPITTNAIRFIRACPKGHMDDVEWSRIIHQNSRCRELYYEWVVLGTELRTILLRCTKCHAQITMDDVYAFTRQHECSGYWAENGQHEACDKTSAVLLKNASNLRIPWVVSSLTIPPMSSQLHNILLHRPIKNIVVSEPTWTKKGLLQKLKYASETAGEIKEHQILALWEAPEKELLQAIEDVKHDLKGAPSPQSVRIQEFERLMYSAVHGAPPEVSKVPQDFEVDKYALRSFRLPWGQTIRVTPIKKLKVTTVQRGYYRPVRGGEDAKPVDRFLFDGIKKWYPGIELRGEGIFLDIPEGPISPDAATAESWLRYYNANGLQVMHPVFVWWHTLSHRIMISLGLDSGYSSASLRERVYFDLGVSQPKGGVLIYAAQRGGDGTLGGLIALVPEFDRILGLAFDGIRICSNDPLCGETMIGPNRQNGAACYACSIVSETSCEWQNKFLDRNLIGSLS